MTKKTATYDDAANAVQIIRQWYYAEVQEIADDLRAAIADGSVTTEDEAHDWLHDTIDGSHLIIYTFKARLALLASDNEDAHEQETGEPAPTTEAAAYYALRADVLDALGNLADLFNTDADE